MRLLSIATVLFGGALSFGCATSLGSASGQERVVVAVDPPVQRTSTGTVEVTEVAPSAAAQPEPPRRRLAQTVTLGQGAGGDYAPLPPPQGVAGNGTSVTVNNNVTVVNGQPVYGGYGYGYGYGGYGYSGNVGVREGRGTTSSPQAWAPNGWEGAQRTAAPGKTPNVGGNFPPVQSSGPAQMK